LTPPFASTLFILGWAFDLSPKGIYWSF
jgi:hypothetical protein